MPDVRGLYPFYIELAERFAQAGYNAIAFDYFGRTAGLGPRAEDFEYKAHVQQLQVPQVQDVKLIAREESLGPSIRVPRVAPEHLSEVLDGGGHLTRPAEGATAEESFLIHSDPLPLPVPDGWAPDAPGVQRASGRDASPSSTPRCASCCRSCVSSPGWCT